MSKALKYQRINDLNYHHLEINMIWYKTYTFLAKICFVHAYNSYTWSISPDWALYILFSRGILPLNEYTYKYEYNSYTWSLTGCNILLHPPHVGLNHTPETPTCKPTVTQPHTLYNSNPGVQWIYDIQISKYLYQRIQISHSMIQIHVSKYCPMDI